MYNEITRSVLGNTPVGKVAEQLGYEVTKSDSQNADINMNLLNWDCTMYGSKHVDAIRPSLSCTQFKIIVTIRKRNLSAAKQIVLRSL